MSLSSLPAELVTKVGIECDYVSSIALSLVNKRYYALTGPLRSHDYDVSALLQIERWPCYDSAGKPEHRHKHEITNQDSFTCSDCLRIRPIFDFANNMVKGNRGKHSREQNHSKSHTGSKASTRFCIDCGIASGRHSPGTMIRVGGSNTDSRGLHVRANGRPGLVCGIRCTFRLLHTGKICLPCKSTLEDALQKAGFRQRYDIRHTGNLQELRRQAQRFL